MKILRIALLGLLVLAAPALGAVQVKVQVHGLRDELQENVLAMLSLRHYKDYGPDPSIMIHRLYAEAPKEIREALQPFGYFSPRIKSQLSRTGNTWTASFSVDPGEPVRFKAVHVTLSGPGAKAAPLRKISTSPPMHAGQTLNQQAYTRTKAMLQETAAEIGYLDAHFTQHVLRVDPRQHSAVATLDFATGPRYRFGQVTIHQHILKPAFLQRYVHITPGEPYDAKALTNLQTALSTSGYFSTVVVKPDKKQASNLKVPIVIDTTPARRNIYRVGLGYGTDTGPRFRFDWENRRVNSKGHRFRFDTRLSRIETQATARYIVPLRNPETDRIVYSSTLNQQDFGGTVSHLFSVGATRVSVIHGWQTGLSLDADRYTSTIGAASRTARLLVPGLSFTRIVADPTDYHQRGFSINATFSGASQALASDASFLRAQLSFHLIVPMGPGRFLVHGEFGAIATNDFAAIPVALRFYAGGDNSVRGYAYQSIGPRNAQGIVVGGRYLKIASVEYDLPIVGNWGIAGFIDAGNASDTLNSTWNKGIGVGVRYLTPVGAIRLDFAHPVSHPQLSYYRIHLSIGLAL